MVSPNLQAELAEELKRLNEVQQRKVLEFARTFKAQPLQGVPGKDLLKFAGLIEPEELKLMAQAIEEDCGKIDYESW